MKKDFKKTFISFKKDEKSIVVYPFQETGWQMDHFTLGNKLCKKFPTHAQTIKVLALMPVPFFYDFRIDEIKVILADTSDYEYISKIYADYIQKGDKGEFSHLIYKNTFENKYREDAEALLLVLQEMGIIKIEQPEEETE